MIRDALSDKVASALSSLIEAGSLPDFEFAAPDISEPKNREHGDFACNIALLSAKKLGMSSMDFGALVAEELSGDSEFEAVAVAPPGFLNLTVTSEALGRHLQTALNNPETLTTTTVEHPLRINVEFVSVNPNGPITIGSGRGAAYGSTLCNVLAAAGHTVHREYYINDGVNSEQMRLFAESVRAHFFGREVPENGYKGDYVEEVANKIVAERPQMNEVSEECVSDTLAYSILDSCFGKADICFAQADFVGMVQGGGWSSRGGDYLTLSDSQDPFEAATDFFSKVLSKVRVLAPWTPEPDWEVIALETKKGGKYFQVQIRNSKEIGMRWLQKRCEMLMLELQKSALDSFGVTFDTWFSEQSLHDSGDVDKCIESLAAKGVADNRPFRTVLKLAKGGKIDEVKLEEQDKLVDDDGNEIQDAGGEKKPTLWLRSTKFGDDMDRVLRRQDGRLTYIASDLSYHADKYNRPPNTDKLITVLGPDHHGYIGRLHAVVAALKMNTTGEFKGSPEPLNEIDAQLYASAEERDRCRIAQEASKEQLEVQIFQLVRFMKDGKPAPMRKRDGNIYALIDLMKEIGELARPEGTEAEKLEVGKDVARFFYLMRSHDTTFDFDLDLAAKQSDENPVFYVQYAHARISGVLRKALTEHEIDGAKIVSGFEKNSALLTHPKEKELIQKTLDLPYEIQRAATDYGVHRLATYAMDLARIYHAFYDNCRVLQPDQRELTLARLGVCMGAQLSLKGALSILGISAPEQM